MATLKDPPPGDDRLARIERAVRRLLRDSREIKQRLTAVENRQPVVHIHNGGTAPEAPGRGQRSGGCAPDIQTYLRGGPRHFSEIIARMVELGHADSTAREHLRQLVALGLVRHPHKGAPYSVPDER